MPLAALAAALMMQAAPHALVMPDWESLPTGPDMAKFYPKAALAARADGRAVISCDVSADRTLTGCHVEAEDPPGLGFGEAAIAMSALFRMKPMTRDGQPVAGGVVRIPIRFTLPPAPEGPTTVVTDATIWKALPTTADFIRVYPEHAFRHGMEGKVTLRCRSDARGAMHNCAVAEETPSGEGFGEAALRLAPRFRMDPSLPGGRSAEGAMVNIPIDFRLPNG